MSMVRKDPNTLELEEMAQLAVNSAFKDQFSRYYASRPKKLPTLEAKVIDVQATSVAETTEAHSPLVPLTEEELAALAQLSAEEAERVRGHEEELARLYIFDLYDYYSLKEVAERINSGELPPPPAELHQVI
jgi:hypothetical protein